MKILDLDGVKKLIEKLKEAFVPRIKGTGSVVAYAENLSNFTLIKISLPIIYTAGSSYNVAFTIRMSLGGKFADIKVSFRVIPEGENFMYTDSNALVDNSDFTKYVIELGYSNDTKRLNMILGDGSTTITAGDVSIMDVHCGQNAVDMYNGWSIETCTIADYIASNTMDTEVSLKLPSASTATSASYANSASTATTATTLKTARTLTIGSTGKSFNGSANVSWSLSEIGAAASSHTHKVKINGTEKTIAASSGSAVDLGTYLTSHQSLANCVQTIKTSGSGNIVTDITKSGSTLTVTKGNSSVDWSEISNTPDNFQSYGITNYVELPFFTTDIMNFQGGGERVAIKVSAENASQYLLGQTHPIRFLSFADGCTFTRTGTCIYNTDLPIFTGTVVDQMQALDDMVAWLSNDGTNYYLTFDSKDNAVNCFDETYTPSSSELVNSWD